MASARELEQQLAKEVEAFQAGKKEVTKHQAIRQQYSTQLGENHMVQKELELLEEESNVYKLIGPVLVKQDLVEAKANVNKRIDYISNELSRIEALIDSQEKKLQHKKEDLMKLQEKLQKLQVASPKK